MCNPNPNRVKAKRERPGYCLPVSTATACGEKNRSVFGSEKKKIKGPRHLNPNPNWVKERRKRKGFGLKMNRAETLTLERILIPNRLNPRRMKRNPNRTRSKRETEKNQRRGRGGPTSPAFRRRGGRKAEPGQLLAGLGKGGTVARPLDGSVLTRWGARALVRGPATAPWPLHRLAPPPSLALVARSVVLG